MPTLAEYREGEIEFAQYGIDISGILESAWMYIKSFFGAGDPLATTATYTDLFRLIATILEVLAVIGIILSLLMLWGWLYAAVRLKKYGDDADAALADEERRFRERALGKRVQNPRRVDIATHIASENPNDWRIAIVEADILLEEILEKQGFVGATIGEKLRGASSESFRTLNDAWEAHKVRNKIAHEGAGFELTGRIATQTIAQYENVFNEFGV
ncbi:hypothetical protein A3C87_01000 [Candidatus Kaiserbacteria bacterium RIFCSPHIGHO2_02_FULL_49_34]|uniref:Uncharacterized protein n=1 Tax=Candidatus Kaiserbacteria bacterium RIFCSPHIGHO2_02_FULL_49_34 TaxID=1798491 RepID=A0A1F6DLZ2_9BACT|nr:MAG: hypothetical protein A3C87_01000 [Candidatus Kaiserbacteria bacterium RIFCSPHIGHO2_02_FULL_49_34]